MEKNYLQKNSNVAIILPSHNEEGNIQHIVNEIHKVMKPLNYEYQILFVDDGSTDKTLAIIEKITEIDDNVFYVELSRNFGHQNALKAGLDIVHSDVAITMDADMQHPPEIIPLMLEKWEEGYDIVYTKREEDKNLGFLKRKTSKSFYKLMNNLSDIEFEEGTADFRLMDRNVIEAFKKISEKDLFIRGLVNWLGFKQYAIDYVPAQRFSGTSKYTLKKMTRFAIQGITSFSTKPLYVAIYLGFGLSFFAFFFYLGYVLYSLYFGHVISGWASVISTIVFFGGINLLVLGIIGMYVGKMFMQTKRRPNYLIRKTNYK